MATIHDLPNKNLLLLSDEEAFQLIKERRANRRVSKARKTSSTRVSAGTKRKPALNARQLASRLSSTQLSQLIQEMEARICT